MLIVSSCSSPSSATSARSSGDQCRGSGCSASSREAASRAWSSSRRSPGMRATCRWGQGVGAGGGGRGPTAAGRQQGQGPLGHQHQHQQRPEGPAHPSGLADRLPGLLAHLEGGLDVASTLLLAQHLPRPPQIQVALCHHEAVAAVDQHLQRVGGSRAYKASESSTLAALLPAGWLAAQAVMAALEAAQHSTTRARHAPASFSSRRRLPPRCTRDSSRTDAHCAPPAPAAGAAGQTQSALHVCGQAGSAWDELQGRQSSRGGSGSTTRQPQGRRAAPSAN